jgi:required for meiotic nuclear division protein 1
LAAPETDSVQIMVKPEGEDQVDPSGGIALKDASAERLQIVGNVLSKSLMLSYYEAKIAGVFDRIEPLASKLQRRGRTGSQARELLRQIGDVLLTQHRMVGRVEIEEKPDVLWDHPELERLYARLEDEYELVERSRAMERKLALINETVGTLIDLVQNQRSVRLEWYIIGLIGIEILLSLYQLFGPGLRWPALR